MLNTTKKLLPLILAASTLLALSACTGTQTAPNMVDYSYVPQNSGVSVVSAPGIESY